MNRVLRLAVLTGFVLLAMLVEMGNPRAAFADDATPPPPDTSSGGTTQTSSTDTPAPSLTDVPSGTSVVIVDATGTPVPLATSTAASSLSSGDPIWCPNGVAPVAGSGGCTTSYSNLGDLVTALTGAEPNKNGVIWLSHGLDSSASNININGGALTTWSNYSLTLQGGWDNSGAGTINGKTTFSRRLSILGWKNSLSINDMIFDGAGGDSLTLGTSAGDIRLKNVEIKNSLGRGAVLNLTGGSGIVNLLNGSFHDNADNGVQITSTSTGSVSLSNVVASINGNFGASIDSTGSVSISSSAFNKNLVDGLRVNSDGSISLNHVTADNNDALGFVNASAYLAAAGPITISNSEFSKNTADGLQAIVQNGDITLSNVVANENDSGALSQQGTFLQTVTGGNISVSSSSFSNNYFDGLQAISRGSVALTNVTANGNGRTGRDVAGTYLRSGPDANINIASSSFNSNGFDGLQAIAGGAVNLNDVNANTNELGGHDVAGTFLVAGPLSNIAIGNSFFSNNRWDGLHAVAGASISLTNVVANSNSINGSSIAGTSLSAGPGGNVSIGLSSFDNNRHDALSAIAGGSITVNRISADSNESSGHGVASTSLLAGPAGDVSISASSFSHNWWDGLHAAAGSDIALQKVTADWNNANGRTTAGTSLSAAGNTTIKDSTFSNNYFDALSSQSGGTLELTNAYAQFNETSGHDQAAAYLTSAGSMAINTGGFNYNGYDGLDVSTGGSATLNGVSAEWNNVYGVNQGGAYVTAAHDISVLGTFRHNAGTGLVASGGGGITLLGVLADSNGGAGANLASGASISIAPSSFSKNTGSGLIASAPGTISVKKSVASSNGGDGVNLTAGGDITLDYVNTDNNAGTGMLLNSGANILIKCGESANNTGYGLNATLPGTLLFDGPYIGGNGAGNVTIGGGGTLVDNPTQCEKEKKPAPTAVPSFVPQPTAAAPTQPPLTTINAQDGQVVTLDCSNFQGTVLALSTRDQIVLLCPVSGQASLRHDTQDQLPGKLDSAVSYVSAMDAQVMVNGIAVQTLPGTMRVDFFIPSDKQSANLSILHWDGTQWADVGGARTADGFFEISTNQTGVFVLITK